MLPVWRLFWATFSVTVLLGASACVRPPDEGEASAGAPVPTAEPTTVQSPTSIPTPDPPAARLVAIQVPRPGLGQGPGGSATGTGTDGVALTFDDGPDPDVTPRMLDLLAAHHVRATFCLIGRQAAAYPAIVARIAAEGHTLCNHSWAHALDLAKQSDDAILRDLRDTSNAISAAAGGAPVRYFRAPGGNFTAHLVALAGGLGLRSIYWAVDPRDWDFTRYPAGQPMVDHIVSVIETQTRPGAIILSHDSRKPDTLAAYVQLLPWLLPRFRLIPLPLE